MPNCNDKINANRIILVPNDRVLLVQDKNSFLLSDYKVIVKEKKKKKKK